MNPDPLTLQPGRSHASTDSVLLCEADRTISHSVQKRSSDLCSRDRTKWYRGSRQTAQSESGLQNSAFHVPKAPVRSKCT